jgi:hypothetical protein
LEENSGDTSGLIVSSTGKYSNIHETNSTDDSLPAGGKPTIDEAIPVVRLSDSEKDKKVFGVISKSSSGKKIVSGISDGETEQDGAQRFEINSLGEGGIWVSNIAGDLENGDYICSSNIPGYGMKQDDDILRNYTVAKITQDCM